MGSIAQYASQSERTVSSQDGQALRELLRWDGASTRAAAAAAPPGAPSSHFDAAFRRLPGEWAAVFARHVEAGRRRLDGDGAGAHEAAEASLLAFSRCFREASTAWVVGGMGSAVRAARRASEEADGASVAGGAAGSGAPGGAGASTKHRTTTADTLRRCFALAVQAPEDPGKKFAALDVVNVSIKLYFALGTLRLARNLIRTVESRSFPSISAFPASQTVCYRYHIGRLALFDEDYELASQSLRSALAGCPAGPRTAPGGAPVRSTPSSRNRSRILRYLAPLQLAAGALPRPGAEAALPELRRYSAISAAVRAGDLPALDHALEAVRERLVEDGTFLLLEKTRQLAYRRLVRLTRAAHAAAVPGSNPTHVPLPWVLAALRASAARAPLGAAEDVALSPDEVECVCSTLIYRKYVKGYISHKNQVMVLAKNDAFPRLEAAQLRDVA